MAEAPPTSGADSSGSSVEEQALEGTGAAPGIAIGTAYRYDASVPEVQRASIEPGEVAEELDLLESALQWAEQELETIQAFAPDSLDADTEAIIEAQALMLRDEEFLDTVRGRIRDHHESAGRAVTQVLQARREKLEHSDDGYLRDRAHDLVDLEKRLLRSLRRGKVAASVEAHSVVVAESLTATELLRFSRHNLLGCVTAKGGATSHLAIVAKALNLPLLVGAPEALPVVDSGDLVILDAEDGRLVVHPEADTLGRYRERQTEYEPTQDDPDPFDHPAETADGRAVTLQANIGLRQELNLLTPYGAEGVGLLRTELLFLAEGGGMLTEDRQADLYASVAEATGDAGATIRLLDFGRDNRLPRLRTGPRETNPALGWRGIRVLLDRPDELLRPQLRALLRANRHGALRVLLPMVTDLAEVRQTKSILAEEAERLAENDIPHDPNLPLGIVVEVPAAALQAHAFTEHVDFFSVGTNDLTQYVLAVDRDNERVGTRHDALHPAVLGLLLRVVEAGRRAGCPVEVCGEVAADVEAVPLLLGLGIESLSVSPQHLPAVQRMVRAVRYSETKDLARTALEAPDAETVRERVRNWVHTHAPSIVSTDS